MKLRTLSWTAIVIGSVFTITFVGWAIGFWVTLAKFSPSQLSRIDPDILTMTKCTVLAICPCLAFLILVFGLLLRDALSKAQQESL